jgi:ribosomal protein S18 acetylase RimI-like enzyme
MDNASITITVADKEHASLIAELSRQTFYDTFAAYNTPENMAQFLETQFSREQLMEEVGAPRNTFLLAWLDNQLAGYARLYDGAELPKELTGTTALEISRLYCTAQAIGKGVGKALMEACLEIGRAQGRQYLWLCVWEHNGRAIAFYEKMGFEIFGKQVFILGQDIQKDWAMKKRL